MDETIYRRTARSNASYEILWWPKCTQNMYLHRLTWSQRPIPDEVANIPTRSVFCYIESYWHQRKMESVESSAWSRWDNGWMAEGYTARCSCAKINRQPHHADKPTRVQLDARLSSQTKTTLSTDHRSRGLFRRIDLWSFQTRRASLTHALISTSAN